MILEDAPDDVRSELSKYVSEGPSFSLDDSDVSLTMCSSCHWSLTGEAILPTLRTEASRTPPARSTLTPSSRGGDDHSISDLRE